MNRLEPCKLHALEIYCIPQLKKASPKVVLENFKKLEYFDHISPPPNFTQIHSLHPHFPTYLTFIFSSFLKDPLDPVCVG